MGSYALRTTSSRGAWRVNWSSEALGLGGAARAYDSEGDDVEAAAPTPEERAAAAVGLDAAFPSRAERRAFPDRLGRRAGVQGYLAVRRACARAPCAAGEPSLHLATARARLRAARCGARAARGAAAARARSAAGGGARDPASRRGAGSAICAWRAAALSTCAAALRAAR
jgi:hypothetical protein